MTPSPPPSATPAVAGLVVAAVLALALNLRQVTVVGPVLPEIKADLGMSNPVAGMLTALPTLCFAVFGATVPWLVGRIGPHRTALLGMAALVLGAFTRTVVQHPVPFMAVSAVALAGMALGNVVLPSLVRTHFPTRIGLATAAYSTAMALGVAVASISVVPLSHALGGWRQAFAAEAIVAAVALVLWIPLARLDVGHSTRVRDPALPLRAVARTRIGWLFAIFFGAQSANAYAVFGWLPSIYLAAGLSPTRAGAMLGVVTLVGLPLSFLIPAYTARQPRPRVALLVIVACAIVGNFGLMLSPTRPDWLWAALAAVGISGFPMILALFGLRSRTIGGTVALSGFTQTFGYLFAMIGPLAMGWLRAATGSFTVPIWFLIVLMVPMAVTGWIVCGGGWVEDELSRAAKAKATS